MGHGWRKPASNVLAALLCLFTLAEVNYPHLAPQSQLAGFAMLGLVLCFLNRPVHPALAEWKIARATDLALALLAVACCAFVIVQTEPWFESWWLTGQSLGDRAGQETAIDTAVGVIGLLLIVEATRRAIGLALPILSALFIAYAWFGPYLPDWLLPHRGYGVERIVAQTFLHSQGVFGTALRVMFAYVFLFVVLGALLRQTGATRFIIDFARGVFGSSAGGPAKVSVLSSGLMGSLSGSAVANTATTGTFTIPLMRSGGFRSEIAAGIEAAASSGGALVPPIMGAGAYMMLEIIEPPVTYLEIIRAALIPAVLYYLSLFLIVHFYARRIGAESPPTDEARRKVSIWEFEGAVFVVGLVGLIALLISGYTVFRAVSIALLLILLISSLNARTRLSARRVLGTLTSAGRDVIPLVSAAACVGIVIGVVTLTGVGTKLPATILAMAQGNRLGALVLIMVSSIILGMGLPSAVCYLLMATLIGSVLADLGIVPLGAHLFIFYFGMMSMVTPPVALAAYTAASIAESGIMRTSFAAFRFALVGFTLPYMFVLRPALLMLNDSGGNARAIDVVLAVTAAVLGIVPFAAAIAGYLFRELGAVHRAILLVASALMLIPGGWFDVGGVQLPALALVGLALLGGVAAVNKWGHAPVATT